MSVSSTGAVLCAVRTAWRPWTCTHARLRRVPTGQLPHDPSRSHHPPSLLQGLDRICKDTGPSTSLGDMFPKARGLCLSRSPRAGLMLPTGRALLSPLPASGAHLSLVMTGCYRGRGGGPDHCPYPPRWLLSRARGRKSASKELSLCFATNAHS